MQVKRAPARGWLWIFGLWCMLGAFDATQTVFSMRAEGMHHAWARLFVTLLLSWLPWAAFTPLVVYLARKYNPLHLQSLLHWFWHVLAWVLMSLVWSAWIAGLNALMNPYALPQPRSFPALWSAYFWNGLLASGILYVCILTVSYGLDSRNRLALQQTETARLNEQLSSAQLNSLRRQIEPHFLFNTLNSVAGLVRENRNDDAVTMLSGLSDFFRRVLQDNNRQEAPLAEEVEFLQRYLEIQQVRFADRLQLSLDVPPELLSASVPVLILQPMVENAVKHGIAKLVQGGAVRVAASRSNGRLNLSVYNDGPKLLADWNEAQTGVGLDNVRNRLRSLYGDEFDLSMSNKGEGGVEVSISLPFREA